VVDDLLSLSERDTNLPSFSTLILVFIRTLIPTLLNNAKRLPPSNTSVMSPDEINSDSFSDMISVSFGNWYSAFCNTSRPL